MAQSYHEKIHWRNQKQILEESLRNLEELNSNQSKIQIFKILIFQQKFKFLKFSTDSKFFWLLANLLATNMMCFLFQCTDEKTRMEIYGILRQHWNVKKVDKFSLFSLCHRMGPEQFEGHTNIRSSTFRFAVMVNVNLNYIY